MTPDLAGKRVVVAGLGLFGGGLGAARWALEQGALVTVTDLRDAAVLAPTLAQLRDTPNNGRLTLSLGGHDPSDFEEADLVVLNPGIPPRAEVMGMIAEGSAQVTTAMALTLSLAKCRVAAVTGTQGKSSTATFLAEVLRHAGSSEAGGRRVELGGNIGGSLLGSIASLGKDDVLVLELSSYQLHHMPKELTGVIDLAAVTNLGADHLSWHGSVDAYHQAKHRIWSLVRSGGFALAPMEIRERVQTEISPGVRLVTHGPGAETRAEARVEARVGAGEQFLLGETALGSIDSLQVPGDFQRHNAACALAAAHLLGTTPSQCSSAVEILSGLPHRMEPLGVWSTLGTDGPRQFSVVDNGISTTPESTLAAMASIDRTSKAGSQKLLLAGGAAKSGLTFSGLARHAAEQGWEVIPFGQAAPALRQALLEGGARANNGDSAPGNGLELGSQGGTSAESSSAEGPMDALWQGTLRVLEDGATVLFSPACASFDAFPNFQSRAVAFRASLETFATERTNQRD